MWLISAEALCRVFPPHAPSPATCGELLADGKSMAVGYADGTRTVWTLQGQVPTRIELGVFSHDVERAQCRPRSSA